MKDYMGSHYSHKENGIEVKVVVITFVGDEEIIGYKLVNNFSSKSKGRDKSPYGYGTIENLPLKKFLAQFREKI